MVILDHLPEPVRSNCLRIGGWMVLFWLCQPWVFYYCLVRQALWRRVAALTWYFWTMYILADSLRTALGMYYSFNVNLIWWIFALLSVKYVHAVLSPQFASQLGLTNFGRIVLFCYCPATIVFEGGVPEHHQPRHATGTTPPHKKTVPVVNYYWKILYYTCRGVIQAVLMGTIAQAILDYRWYDRFPGWMQNIVAFYQIQLSQGMVSDIAMTAPTWAVVGSLLPQQPQQSGSSFYVVEPSNLPVASTVPRYFWHRWSKSPGFHLRWAIYEPLGGRPTNSTRSSAIWLQWRNTMATFGLNCLLHVAWWGQVSAGTWAWEYMWVLLVAPALGLALDKHVLIPLFQRSNNDKQQPDDDTRRMDTVGRFQRRLLYHGTSLVALQAMAAWFMPYFLKAQGMPESLQDLALLQTGRFSK